MKHKKPAFTMIELIFAIVVMGILAAMAMPRMERDLRQEAADNVLSAIRYTQHNALMDNKTNPDSRVWQKAFWQIRFANNGSEWQYIVASNSDYGANLDQNESAIDPANGKYLHTSDATRDTDESSSIFLSEKYGINSVDFTNCGGETSRHIAFDYLGRPHRGVFSASNDMATLMQANCEIKFSFDDGTNDLKIRIRKETGYATIVGQPNS